MKKIALYSLISGVGSTTIGYQLARLLRVPFFQEQKNDLVFLLKSLLDGTKYRVGQMDEFGKSKKDYEWVVDLKSANKRVFQEADVILVLINNSFVDILKAIATIEKIVNTLKTSPKNIHIVFNRLQLGNASSREKKYTAVSKKILDEHFPNLTLKYSYIRTGFVYYRFIEKGNFFMDSFFKWNKDILEFYPEIKEVPHSKHLEMFYDYQYEKNQYDFSELTEYNNFYEDTLVKVSASKETSKLIANQNFHQENIRLSRAAIKDMYSLLYKIGGIYGDFIEKDGKKYYRKHIERN